MGKNWNKELAVLRSIIEKTQLIKTIKWGGDVYTYKGKNVVGYAGFKTYFALWFYNGVFLKDKHRVLINAQEGKTKALRQWRFYSDEEINEPLIMEYLHEAIKNEEAGMSWKPQKTKEPSMPEVMADCFRKNKKLNEAFTALTPYKQKEYIEYLGSAKREETKIKRMERIIPMILDGAGLNDQYKM